MERLQEVDLRGSQQAWASDDSEDDERVSKYAQQHITKASSAPTDNRAGFLLPPVSSDTTSDLTMRGLLSPKFRNRRNTSKRMSFHGRATPRKGTSPRSPRTTVAEVDAVKRAIPNFLDTKAIPWKVDQLLNRLREAVVNLAEAEEEEEDTSNVELLANALGRELCLLKCGGYIAITLQDKKVSLKLLATAEQISPESIKWQMKELKSLPSQSKKKIKRAQSKRGGSWTPIYFLESIYYLQGHKVYTLCDHLGLARADGPITLASTQDSGIFELSYDKISSSKPLVLHCDLPFYIRRWWEAIKEDHWDPELPDELDTVPVIGLLRKVISQIDVDLSESCILDPKAFNRKWPLICIQILRVWDLFEQMANLKTWESGLLELRIDEQVVISHRVPTGVDRSLLPHPLWFLQGGERALTDLLNKCHNAIPINWKPYFSNSPCTRYLPHDELIAFVGSHCPKHFFTDLKPGDISSTVIGVDGTQLTRLEITPKGKLPLVVVPNESKN
jgi:hypothetical protein